MSAAPPLRAGDQGAVTGRGTGVIDTIHLVEVARAVAGPRAVAIGSAAGDRDAIDAAGSPTT